MHGREGLLALLLAHLELSSHIIELVGQSFLFFGQLLLLFFSLLERVAELRYFFLGRVLFLLERPTLFVELFNLLL